MRHHHCSCGPGPPLIPARGGAPSHRRAPGAPPLQGLPGVPAARGPAPADPRAVRPPRPSPELLPAGGSSAPLDTNNVRTALRASPRASGSSELGDLERRGAGKGRPVLRPGEGAGQRLGVEPSASHPPPGGSGRPMSLGNPFFKRKLFLIQVSKETLSVSPRPLSWPSHASPTAAEKSFCPGLRSRASLEEPESKGRKGPKDQSLALFRGVNVGLGRSSATTN